MPRLFGFANVPIPGPKRSRVFGHFPALLRFLDDPLTVLDQLRPYGDVVALERDNPALVCVFGAARNREVLSNPSCFRHNEDFLRGRPGSPLGRMSHVIVNINGEEHKRHRRLMMPAFAKSALAGYADEIVEVSEDLVARWPIGEVADLDALLRELTLAIAIRTLFGLDVHTDRSGLADTASEFIDALASPLAILLPYELPGTPYRHAQRCAGKVLERLERLIADKRRAPDTQTDALARLLSAVDDDGVRLSDDELLAEATTLFIAGHDTMAKTMTWTMFLLERHPAVLADLLDEIDGVLGGRSPSVADIPRMPLLDRVIKESMRVLGSVPLLFLRVPADEVSLGSVTLPKGANVVVSPYATHRDPELYPRPERFDPERWNGLERSIYEYLPFGAGPRICLGVTFAAQALRLMLPTVLQRVRVAIVAGADITRITRSNIMRPRFGIPVRLQPPHRRKLRPAAIRGDIGELVELGS